MRNAPFIYHGFNFKKHFLCAFNGECGNEKHTLCPYCFFNDIFQFLPSRFLVLMRPVAIHRLHHEIVRPCQRFCVGKNRVGSVSQIPGKYNRLAAPHTLHHRRTKNMPRVFELCSDATPKYHLFVVRNRPPERKRPIHIGMCIETVTSALFAPVYIYTVPQDELCEVFCRRGGINRSTKPLPHEQRNAPCVVKMRVGDKKRLYFLWIVGELLFILRLFAIHRTLKKPAVNENLRPSRIKEKV